MGTDFLILCKWCNRATRREANFCTECSGDATFTTPPHLITLNGRPVKDNKPDKDQLDSLPMLDRRLLQYKLFLNTIHKSFCDIIQLSMEIEDQTYRLDMRRDCYEQCTCDLYKILNRLETDITRIERAAVERRARVQNYYDCD